MCWRHKWIGSNTVQLVHPKDSKFRKGKVLKFDTNSQITFEHQTFTTSTQMKIEKAQNCHWEVLEYEESTKVAPPQMTFWTKVGFGLKKPSAKNDADN